MKRDPRYEILEEEGLSEEMLGLIKAYLEENCFSQIPDNAVGTYMFYSKKHDQRVPVDVRSIEEPEDRSILAITVHEPKRLQAIPEGIDIFQDMVIDECRWETWTGTLEEIRRHTERDRSFLTIEEVHRFFPPFQHIFEAGEHSTTFQEVILD